MYFVVLNMIINEKQKFRIENATFANDTRLNPTSPQDYIFSLRLTIVHRSETRKFPNLRLIPGLQSILD